MNIFTDSGGMYIASVSTGQYQAFMSPNYDEDWNYTESDYLTIYYNGKYSWDSADPIVLDETAPFASGGAIPYVADGIDFVMEQGVYINGTVEDSEGPLADIDISAQDADTGNVAYATTNSSGEYSLLVPTEMDFFVYACPSCNSQPYGDKYYGDVDPWVDSPNVSVATTDVTLNAMVLEVAYSISGTVTESDDITPIENIMVEIWDTAGDWVASTMTDENGDYSIMATEGSYKVSVCPTCTDGTPLPYQSEYYNDADSFGSADVVEVDGDNVGLINFSLADANMISGTVYEDDGTTPITNLHVFVEDLNGNWIEGSNTNDSGDYSIPVAPGEYKVKACPTCMDTPLHFIDEYYQDAISFDDADTVDVSGGDQGGINFVLNPASFISGTVYENDGSTTIPYLQVYAVDSETEEWVAGVDSDDYGNYTLAVPAGRSYIVRACPTCSSQPYIEEFYNEKADYDNADEVDTSSSDQTGINFTLDPGSVIRGFVYDNDGGSPISSLSIEVEDENGVWVAGGETWDNGSYYIVLPEGTYKVRAHPSAQTWTEPPAYRDEYYQDTLDFSLATEVTTSFETEQVVDFGLDALRDGDFNQDGALDLKDVIEALKCLTGENGENIRADNSPDDDNRIGMSDVLYLLNNLD